MTIEEIKQSFGKEVVFVDTLHIWYYKYYKRKPSDIKRIRKFKLVGWFDEEQKSIEAINERGVEVIFWYFDKFFSMDLLKLSKNEQFEYIKKNIPVFFPENEVVKTEPEIIIKVELPKKKKFENISIFDLLEV